MEELGSIISIMLDNNKDIVLTTTNQISFFKEHKRLYNRLLSAVFIKIETPSQELKYKICQFFADKSKLIIENDILLYLTNNLIGGAREIKGAFDRIKINLSNVNISIPAIANLLDDLIIKNQENKIYNNDISMIIDQIASYYQISTTDLKNPRAIKNNKLYRSVSFYLCREICSLTYAQIANEFGLSTHASIIHSIKKLTSTLKTNNSLQQDINFIMANIRKCLGI